MHQTVDRPIAQPPALELDAPAAVEVQDLVKTFPAPGGGVLTAVDHISFSVRRGEIFGFLGPNGAGKTTTLEIIEGLQSPTAGKTLVLGLDSRRERDQVKERIGVQLQAGAYFDYLTLEEILDLFGSFYARSVPPDELLRRVGLEEKRKAQVQHLSGGQAHRFSVVAALVNDPEVIFLDEPTTGLDPQARHHLWDFIASLKTQGKTVVLTTHYMEEAALLCDRVAIIDQGTIKALDTPLGLVRRLPAAYHVSFSTHVPIRDADLRNLPGVLRVDCSTNHASHYELHMAQVQVTLEALMEWVERNGITLDDLQVAPATLEDAFLALTGRRLRE